MIVIYCHIECHCLNLSLSIASVVGSAAALSYFPPVAAFSSSIAAFDFYLMPSREGVTTFTYFAFLDAGVFPARRLETLNYAAIPLFPTAGHCDSSGHSQAAGEERNIMS